MRAGTCAPRPVPSTVVHPVTRRIIDATPARLRPGVELLFRTVDDSINDRVPGLAAEIAFFALLSLPPLLLTILAGIGALGDLFHQSWRAAGAASHPRLGRRGRSPRTASTRCATRCCRR